MRQDPSRTSARRRAVPLAALGAGAALLLSACGASGDDASAAWDAARAQLEGASSVRMTTELRSDAGSGVSMPDSTDVAGSVDGADMAYTGVFRSGDYTTRDESRVVGGTRYERFLLERRGGVSGEDRPVFAQKWTQAPAQQGATTMRSVVDGLLAGVPGSGGLADAHAEAAPIRRSGEDATRYVLDEPVGGTASGTRLKAFTVADDDGELLTVETVAPGTEATVTFSEWDAVEPVVAPAAEDLAASAQQSR